MELIFNPCDEFRRSQEGPVSQIHFPRLHFGAPGIFSDLLMSVQMLGCGKQREATTPIQTLAKLQLWFQSFWWKTCLCAQNSDDNDDDDDEDDDILK